LQIQDQVCKRRIFNVCGNLSEVKTTLNVQVALLVVQQSKRQKFESFAAARPRTVALCTYRKTETLTV